MHRIGIRKGDKIRVMKGRERGKEGKIILVSREKNTVLVEKLNMIKRHQRPTQKNPTGGIVEKEAPIQIANVRLICPKCSQLSRAVWRALEDGKRVRACKKCNELIG